MLYTDISQWEHTVRGAQYDKANWCWRKLSNDYMCGWATASQTSSGYAIIVCVAMHSHAHEPARQLHGSLQGSCKAVCKAVLVVKSCANISSCFLPISLSSHWLPLAQPLLTARHLQGILHGTCAWQNLEAAVDLTTSSS